VVDGRILIDDRKVTFVDEDELLAEARIAAARVFKAAGVESRLNR